MGGRAGVSSPSLLAAVAALAALAGGGGAGPAPPELQSLRPPRGHVAGGTAVTLRGRGFRRGPGLAARFAAESSVSEVPCRFVSSLEVVCVSPPRSLPHTAHVTASNGGGVFSAYPLVYVRGSGSFLRFEYDNSDPGCYGCNELGLQAALSPGERVREHWAADHDEGPVSGGTAITINATDLVHPNGTRAVGGSGTPGTFYPGSGLLCTFACVGDDGKTFPNLDVRAEWLDYNRVVCPSPALYEPWESTVEQVRAPSGEDEVGGEGGGTHGLYGLYGLYGLSAGGPRLQSVVRHSRDLAPEGAVCRILVTNSGGAGAAYESQANGAFNNSPVLSFRYSLAVPTLLTAATAAVPHQPPGPGPPPLVARLPFQGKTEVLLGGSGFQSSPALTCRFTFPVRGESLPQEQAGGGLRSVEVPARFDSDSRAQCLSPPLHWLNSQWEANSHSLYGPTQHVHFVPTEELPTLEPCTLGNISVSNSLGLWSNALPLLLCDLYVSPSGSDTVGTGMPYNPFRTLQRAIAAALREPRPGDQAPRGGLGGNRGRASPGDFVNHDRVVVAPGVYTGDGNVELQSQSRVVTLEAHGKGRVEIDCRGHGRALASTAPAAHALPALGDPPAGTPAAPQQRGHIHLRGVHLRACAGGTHGQDRPARSRAPPGSPQPVQYSQNLGPHPAPLRPP